MAFINYYYIIIYTIIIILYILIRIKLNRGSYNRHFPEAFVYFETLQIYKTQIYCLLVPFKQNLLWLILFPRFFKEAYLVKVFVKKIPPNSF